MAKSTTTSKTTQTTKSKAALAPAAKTKTAAPAPAKTAAAKPAPKAAKPTKENLGDDAIAKRAYELWVEQGYPEGRDLENWTRAEKELKGK